MGWETFDIDRAEPLLIVGTRHIGSMVKRRREQLGLSQRRLALVVGCHQSVISRLENGKITSMRYRRFAFIVGVLGGLDQHAPLPRWRMPFIPEKLVWAVNLEAERLASMPFPSPPPQPPITSSPPRRPFPSPPPRRPFPSPPLRWPSDASESHQSEGIEPAAELDDEG